MPLVVDAGAGEEGHEPVVELWKCEEHCFEEVEHDKFGGPILIESPLHQDQVGEVREVC